MDIYRFIFHLFCIYHLFMDWCMDSLSISIPGRLLLLIFGDRHWKILVCAWRFAVLRLGFNMLIFVHLQNLYTKKSAIFKSK